MVFKQALTEFQDEFSTHLDNTFNQLPESIAPNLKNAMQYSVQNGGKRIRPYLMRLVAKMLNVPFDKLLPAAIALECIHSYSLVHDDLPAMDDDNLRRGLPTCHIKYDEATAILAGDALQAFAFQLIAQANVSDSIKIKWLTQLSTHAGYLGMCGGQSLDLVYENTSVRLEQLETIHNLKTGALLRCAVNMACASVEDLPIEHANKMDAFAQLIGLAFQIQDDILDLTSTTSELGKPQGSDEKLNKSTYPNLLTLAGAQTKAQEVYQSALAQIQQLPYNVEYLVEFAQFIVQRKH